MQKISPASPDTPSSSPSPRRVESICVYCGSGRGVNPAYAVAARKLGKALADNGIRLVYGGGSLGLMGEVAKSALGAGGKVLNIVDLSDVYMAFFLPTEQAGQVAIGTEVRLVLDAAPQFVVPANVSFVADVAQFTPKTVETADERQKLMFQVKARIAPELLKKHVRQVKTGLPGMAYVRLRPGVAWPPNLQAKLPQ